MSSAIEILARQLADARRERRHSSPFPTSVIETLPEAYEVQKLATAAYGDQIGYKIGATSPTAQRMMGCDGPFFGPLFAEDSHGDGETLAIDETMLAIECEFAFRMGQPANPLLGAETAETIATSVESCHPAIEIVGRRVPTEGFPGLIDAIADYGLNARFIAGEAMIGWREADLAGTLVRGHVDGVETNAGSGAQVLGHPLAALAWLANALRAQGGGLKEGDWVTTGTCLGVVPIREDSTVVGDFGPLGSVTVEFRGHS